MTSSKNYGPDEMKDVYSVIYDLRLQGQHDRAAKLEESVDKLTKRERFQYKLLFLTL